MAKRLIKIAKELNVGTSTIVEHLHNSGFEIENKPTAKVSDEMYAELLKEFQKSIAIKEKAKQLVIGNRPNAEPKESKKEKEKTAPPTPRQTEEKEASKPAAKPTPPSTDNGKQAEEQPKTPKQPAEEETTERKKPGLKILGKVNLDEKGKPVKEKAPAPAEEQKEQAAPPVEAKQETPKEEAPKKEEPKAEEQPKPEAPKADPPKAEEAPTPKEQPKEQPKEESKTPTPAKEEKETPVAEQKGQEEKPKAQQPEPKEEQPKPAAEQTPPKTEKPASDEPKKATQPDAATGKDKPEAKPDAAASGESTKDAPKEKEGEAGANSDKKGKEETVRATAPELRGLKIMGKIDVAKVERSKRGKRKKDTKATEGNSSSSSGSSDEPRKKRRRKRKKVTPDSSGSTSRRPARGKDSGGRRGKRKSDEVKEVSQKEIEDKIKATMARISGGGKRKRQKIRRDNRERMRERQEEREMEQESKNLEVTEFISVQELANLMDVPVTDVITTCMNLGVIVSINQRLDAEIIELVTEEFGHEVEFIDVGEDDAEEEEIIDDPEDLEPRAPIVTVMGHVDHGKTSLLDYIRKAKVAAGEAGGITQHIGAYEVVLGEEEGLDEQKKITFLDTPGHEAFTAMRARGAKVTDIAVIIIAADDNIMPQTKEAISHAQAAGVPIVFAINKIDKPGAQPDRIKQELANMDLLVEEWGGKYQSQDISAKTGLGIDDLLEKIVLEADVLELQANPDREASGTVVEASLDKGRGYVTKLLVQSGTLNIGDPMVAGEHSGKVKAMFNELGQRVQEAGPSTPVLVLGLSGAPQAGERFKVMESEQDTRALATKRSQIAREQANRATKRISLDEIGRRLALGNFKELNLIVKGDVDGSVEALADSLIKQSIETVQVNVIHKGVGQIIESDVLLASASDAIIIGFQVRPSMGARQLAEREGVEIKMYSVIYKAIEEIRAAIEGMLEPTKEEKIVAQVEVRDIFKISKVGTVAGCFVQEGKITRNTHVRIIRDGIVIYPTKEGQVAELSSLKRFKDDVREVKAGLECGLSVKNYNDIKVGDIVEGYEIVEIKQTLD
jgi:translation initiation factor IF-2